MKLPKFIITMDGMFRLGMVDQHRDLLQPDEQCIGGGYYSFDFVSNRIILDRESYDFGRPKWHLLDTLRVPSTYRGLRIVYKYDDGSHDDFNVSELVKIEYYDRLRLHLAHAGRTPNGLLTASADSLRHAVLLCLSIITIKTVCKSTTRCGIFSIFALYCENY